MASFDNRFTSQVDFKTLLSLTFMIRLSDIASREELFDTANNSTYPSTLSRYNVIFRSDNSVTITFSPRNIVYVNKLIYLS